MTDTSNDAVARMCLAMINSGNTTTANMLTALADERDRLATAHTQLMQSLDAANARADQAEAQISGARDAIAYVLDGYGLNGPDFNRQPEDDPDDWIVLHLRAAILALRDKPAPGITVQEAARVLMDQPYSVMSAAFDAMEKLHGEGADRIMAAALRAIAGGGDE